MPWFRRRPAALVLAALAACASPPPGISNLKSAISNGGGGAPPPPQWAVDYCEGLKAWRDVIYYWIDRQKPDGTFGFGWGDDVEMTVGWPGVMMAADDRKIERALERLADNNWFNSNIQDGYVWLATDGEHGPEPMSYSYPALLYQRFGSPKFIERCMITAKNVERWTGLTPKGDRHMKSTYFGSRQMYDWPYYDADCPINARAWIPMMQLALYNRDPHLMKYLTEWADAWAKHAMDTTWGKPPGFLPGEVVFSTGEVGGYTSNWWGAGAHEFSSVWYQTRMNELLVVAYALTKDEKYIRPLRSALDFLSKHARPGSGLRRAEGEGDLPPDRLPPEYQYPPGWRDGTKSTEWARDYAKGHFLNWYYYLTGDTQFDEPFSKILGEPIERGPYKTIDKDLVSRARQRAVRFRDEYFKKTLPKLDMSSSISNYAAAFWQKQYGTMTFGNRCFRDGGKLANNVNWPWVDFPPPSVVWKNTGYETGIFVLEDSPTCFRAALCNLEDRPRHVEAQLFTLDEGDYHFCSGPDEDENGAMDSVTFTTPQQVRHGTFIRLNLPPNVTTLVELRRDPASSPPPPWRSRPDLGLDPWDIMVSKKNPVPGETITITVRVHNVGTEMARNVRVDLQAWSAEAAVHTVDMQLLSDIPPPKNLVPSWRDVTFEWTVESTDWLGVNIDPISKIDELFEDNNAAAVDLNEIDKPLVFDVWGRLNLAQSAQPSKAAHDAVPRPPAKRPSLADVTSKDLAEYVAPFRAGIVVDGKVDPAEWGDAPVYTLVSHGKKSVAKATRMRMAYDDAALVIALECDEPDMGLVDTDLKNIHQIYYKDGFEIFVDPGAEVWRYWQLVFDAAEHTFQTLARNEFAPKADWQVKVAKGEKAWSAEVRLPYASFGKTKPAEGDRWRLNVMRNTTTLRDPEKPDRPVEERSHFSPRGRLHNHHDATLFGDVWFGAKRQ